MIRLDLALRQWGLAPSRAKAQELLREGAVEVFTHQGWQVCRDEAHKVAAENPESVRVVATAEALQFVSRGGRKLAGLLEQIQLDVSDWLALDVGVSTGGFSDCLLQRGVREIVGIDVGHGQLAQKLKAEPRLKWFEGINARELNRHAVMQPWAKIGFDLVVVDVSFISLEMILPGIHDLIRAGGTLLALVKPQFEVAQENHNRRGIVTDLVLHQQVRDKIEALVERLSLQVIDYRPCVLPGQDGNQEYFLYAKKTM